MPVHSRSELAAAILEAGFPPSEIERALAIIAAESGGDPGATNDTPGQEYSVGPWQINLMAHPQVGEACARDLECSTRYAYSLFSTQGWQPWGAYTSGAYKEHLTGGGKNMATNFTGGSTVPPGYRFRKTPATKIDANGNKGLDIQQVQGGIIVRYTDGDYDVITDAELYGQQDNAATEYQQGQLALGAAGNKLTARGQDVTAQGNQLQAQAQQANLELQKAQFEYNKAKDNKDFAAQQYWLGRQDYWTAQKNEVDRLSLNVSRGNTLLGLGSRPETMWKYLFGVRGEQTPQGDFTNSQQLPGYTNQEINATLAGTGAAGAFGGGAGAGAGAAGGQAANLLPNGKPAIIDHATGQPDYTINPITGKHDAGLAPNTGYQPGANPYVAAIDPKTGAPMTGAPQVASNTSLTIPGTQMTQGMTPQDLAAQSAKLLPTTQERPNAMVAPGQKPKYVGENGTLIYDSGGLIDEPVIGKGFLSGKNYMFGMNGQQEQVTPSGSSQGSGLSGKLFNPPGLQGQIDKGFAGVKSPPQLQAATGGTSLLPSAQRWSNLLPTEQKFYQGSLQDLWGIPPEDVTALQGQGRMKRQLMPGRYAR